MLDPGPLLPTWQGWIHALGSSAPRILLADGDDDRALEAAAWLSARSPVRPVLVVERGAGPDVPRDVEVATARDLREAQGVTDVVHRRPDGSERPDEEAAAVEADPLLLAATQLVAGTDDGCVAGAGRPTRDVIRAGLKVVGLAPGSSSVTSSFLLVLPDGRRWAYGDCAVLPTPDDEQLADVAGATAATFRTLTGEEPVVAMLSFSTHGSAEHPDVDLVRRATHRARQRFPELRLDGELQFDAAVVESVARAKAPGSSAAGRANVMVFPNLAAANIGYKITERLAGASAVGPLLQGLRAPLHDLSRGCSSADIVSVALVSALQAVEG